MPPRPRTRRTLYLPTLPVEVTSMVTVRVPQSNEKQPVQWISKSPAALKLYKCKEVAEVVCQDVTMPRMRKPIGKAGD